MIDDLEDFLKGCGFLRHFCTRDIKEMKEVSLAVRGRHDVCIVPRAAAVVEAMMAVTLGDFALRAGLIPRVIK